MQLWIWLVERLSFGDADIVYDPFLGSGTTLIAADQLGRVCYGMEIDPRYCDVIKQRYAAYQEAKDAAAGKQEAIA